MNDLIIVLNLKESTQQYCLVETYLGELKALKKRTFSGPLRAVDVLWLDNVKNLTDVLLKEIKIFLRDESRQTKKNKYLLSFSSFIKFLSLLSGVKGVFCTSYDKSLYELDGLQMAELKIAADNTSNSRGQLFLNIVGGEKLYLSKKSYCYNICGKTFIFTDNHLYLIDQIPDLRALKGFISSKRKILSEADLNRLRCSTKEVGNTPKEYANLHPVPVLYVRFLTTAIYGKFYFSYNGYEVPSNSSEERLHDERNGAVYLRSLMEERHALTQLKIAGWRQLAGNSFVLDGDSAERSLSQLLENHFEVLAFDHKKVCSAKSANFNISYGVDWFELTATTAGKERDLTHLIDLKSRKRYIELDNEMIILPDAIWENRNIFNQSDSKMKAAKKHIGQIFEILEQPGVTSTFQPDELIDFRNIHLLLPNRLNNTLRSYQKNGVRWLLYLYQNRLGGCLADDMGLGKTIQAIAFVASQYYEGKQPMQVLVVVPKTLIENWRTEFKKFGEGICVCIYHGVNRERELKKFEQAGGVLLTTYNTLLNDMEILAKFTFGCMFIDEAQYIKNYKAKTHAAVQKMKAQSKFILSGTPFENNIAELWALMDLINPGCLGNRTAFMKKYADLSLNKEILKRLNARIKPFVLRRLKKDVLNELPEKTEHNVICDMGDSQRELYQSILISVRNELARIPNRFEIKDASTILEGLLYLRQVCCHPALLKRTLNWNNCNESGKFDLFKLKIDELQTNHEKVVVFSQFTTMLGIMKKWAKSRGYTTFYLDGATKRRQEVVDSFERSDKGIFFISLKAGGVGLNIVSCQYAIIYDPWWNPAVENQAADRIYRIGQKKNVFIYHLITANSIEEKIEELKTEKREIADNLLSDTGWSGKLSIEELKKLIVE